MKDTSRHEVVQCSLEKTEIRKSFMKKCRQFGWLVMPIIPVTERVKQKNGQVQASWACQGRANLKTKSRNKRRGQDSLPQLPACSATQATGVHKPEDSPSAHIPSSD